LSKVRGMIDGAVRDAFNMHPEYLSPEVCPVTVRKGPMTTRELAVYLIREKGLDEGDNVQGPTTYRRFARLLPPEPWTFAPKPRLALCNPKKNPLARLALL